jgi:hypothetical protein
MALIAYDKADAAVFEATRQQRRHPTIRAVSAVTNPLPRARVRRRAARISSSAALSSSRVYSWVVSVEAFSTRTL